MTEEIKIYESGKTGTWPTWDGKFTLEKRGSPHGDYTIFREHLCIKVDALRYRRTVDGEILEVRNNGIFSYGRFDHKRKERWEEIFYKCEDRKDNGKSSDTCVNINNSNSFDWCEWCSCPRSKAVDNKPLGVTNQALLDIQGLKNRVEELEEKIRRIKDWCDAYPVNIFPEPDFKKVKEVLKADGMTLDSVSASNMRHVLNGIKKIINK